MAQRWRVPTPTPTPTDGWASYFDSWRKEDQELPAFEPIIVDGEFPPEMQNLPFNLDMDVDWDFDMQSPFIGSKMGQAKLHDAHHFGIGKNMSHGHDGRVDDDDMHDVDAWGYDDLLLPEIQIQQMDGEGQESSLTGSLKASLEPGTGPLAGPLVGPLSDHLECPLETCLWSTDRWEQERSLGLDSGFCQSHSDSGHQDHHQSYYRHGLQAPHAYRQQHHPHHPQSQHQPPPPASLALPLSSRRRHQDQRHTQVRTHCSFLTFHLFPYPP